ncbi:MAG: type II secretion system secretin GspD [Betaproteobacteria bacterium]
MTKRHLALPCAALVAVVLVTACATSPDVGQPPTLKSLPNRGTSNVSMALAEGAEKGQVQTPPPVEDKSRLFKGTGVLVKGQQQGGGLPSGPVVVQQGGGGVVLNFEGADLREVVRNILGDILNESYTIDPSVGGQVTIRTASGIPRDALIATLETLLRMNGAAMVKEGGLYKILPSAAAVRGNITPQLGNSQRALPSGFSVQIVPLRFVGVREMVRILEPFVKDATAVRPDDLRNMLILAGSERELKHLLETIDTFDVDWMAGMSVGLFTLQFADVKAVTAEIDKAIGDRNTGPLAGILRIIPIERLNAFLVITPQPAYLEEAKKWVVRLDQPGTGDGPRFFVYNLQNTRAEKLAPLLQQAFSGRAAPAAAPSAPTVAPGTPAGTIVSPPQYQPTPTTPQPQVVIQDQRPQATPAAATGAAAAAGLGIIRNIQVVADKDNNTLLIVATAPEYTVIEAAVKKLDVPARQVMIEVTIAQVALTDEINFGVEWLFKGGAPSGRGTGGNITRSTPLNPLSNAATDPALSLAKGFVYIINNANFPGGIQAILHLLDTYGDTKVIANPHLGALDNQKATIKSGERIPINQQTNVGGTVNGVVTTTSQYIDTGVLLQVTPHINAGGLVTLDVQAEVSDPGNFVPGEAPPINTRSVQTMVSVQSGQTMVMGGLIGETKQLSSSGLPLLSRIPIIGGLFGEQTIKNNRTELIMFITPRVVENEFDVKNVIDDLRRRMGRLDEEFPRTKIEAKPAQPPAAAPQ